MNKCSDLLKQVNITGKTVYKAKTEFMLTSLKVFLYNHIYFSISQISLAEMPNEMPKCATL